MNLVLADDHKMMRDGLRAVFEKVGIEVVGDASNGHEAIAEAKSARPDVVIVDVAMPLLNGVDATRRVTKEMPGIKVIALSTNSDRRYVIAIFEAGAVGYLLESAASEELISALEVVHGGATYVSPSIAGSVVEQAIRRETPDGRTDRTDTPLSLREREVLQLVAEASRGRRVAFTTIESDLCAHDPPAGAREDRSSRAGELPCTAIDPGVHGRVDCPSGS